MGLYSTVLTISSGQSASNAIALPPNTVGLSVFVPTGATGGPFFVALSPDNGTTYYLASSSQAAGTFIPVAGVAALGGNTVFRLQASSNATANVVSTVRYRTEETLNSSFLLT